jgi:hypothetical protein
MRKKHILKTRERELEDDLINKLRDFILEPGYSFYRIGHHRRLVLGQKKYFIDLLFYHRFLKCLVAIELKIDAFEPEYAGKIDFYLNLLNDRERAPDDNPSIDIIFCDEKDGLENDNELRKHYHHDAKQEPQIRKNFCKRDQQPKILIVTEKRLTGFDAWPCAVL